MMKILGTIAMLVVSELVTLCVAALIHRFRRSAA